MESFAGKTALVTGGGTGIGLELARALAGEGAKVAIAGTSVQRLETEAEALRRTGADAMAIELDVTDVEKWPNALAVVEHAFGPVDLLVLNAGVSTEMCALEDTPVEVWRRIVDVNLNALFYAVRAWLPAAKARMSVSHVLITGSLTGLMTMTGCNAYGASKAGVWMFADILRAELAGSQIGVSLLSPGVTRTDLVETTRRHNPVFAKLPPNERVLSFVRNGADPAKVAAFTLAAVKRGDFHICSHPEHRAGVERRFQAALEAMTDPADENYVGRPRPTGSGRE